MTRLEFIVLPFLSLFTKKKKYVERRYYRVFSSISEIDSSWKALSYPENYGQLEYYKLVVKSHPKYYKIEYLNRVEVKGSPWRVPKPGEWPDPTW